jgi:hypothetical protein
MIRWYQLNNVEYLDQVNTHRRTIQGSRSNDRIDFARLKYNDCLSYRDVSVWCDTSIDVSVWNGTCTSSMILFLNDHKERIQDVNVQFNNDETSWSSFDEHSTLIYFSLRRTGWVRFVQMCLCVCVCYMLEYTLYYLCNSVKPITNVLELSNHRLQMCSSNCLRNSHVGK